MNWEPHIHIYRLCRTKLDSKIYILGSTASFHCTTPLQIRPFIHWVKILPNLDFKVKKEPVPSSEFVILSYKDPVPSSNIILHLKRTCTFYKFLI